MRLAALALGVPLFFAAACSSGAADQSSSSTTTTTPAVAPLVDPSCAQFHGTTSPLSSTGERPVSLLVDASAEAVGCLDRVTFEFESLGDGTPPGYRVAYRDVATEPLLDANGNEISLPGSAFLVVQISPASSNDPRVEEQPATYRGNLRLSYGENHHLEVVQKLPDVLGAVEWVIGLDAERPFIVDSAAGPPRVSVYIG
jgi:hypothetical protein